MEDTGTATISKLKACASERQGMVPDSRRECNKEREVPSKDTTGEIQILARFSLPPPATAPPPVPSHFNWNSASRGITSKCFLFIKLWGHTLPGFVLFGKTSWKIIFIFGLTIVFLLDVVVHAYNLNTQ